MQKKLKKKENDFAEKVDGAEKNKNSRRDALFDTNSIRNRINDDNDLGQLSSNDKKKKFKMLYKNLKIGWKRIQMQQVKRLKKKEKN